MQIVAPLQMPIIKNLYTYSMIEKLYYYYLNAVQNSSCDVQPIQ